MHLSPQRSLGKQRVLKTISGLALTLLSLAEYDTEVLYFSLLFLFDATLDSTQSST
jgi:hypothetical protein